MTRLTVIAVSLILLAGTVLAQNAKHPANAKPKMKTIRLHIDGFQKSKSGAV